MYNVLNQVPQEGELKGLLAVKLAQLQQNGLKIPLNTLFGEFNRTKGQSNQKIVHAKESFDLKIPET